MQKKFTYLIVRRWYDFSECSTICLFNFMKIGFAADMIINKLF